MVDVSIDESVTQMTNEEILAARFEAQRPRLRSIALRMLGNASEADDAVQEAWLRLSRTGGDAIDNLDGWLTTVVSRVSLDMLRSRAARRLDDTGNERDEPLAVALGPEDELMLDDALGVARLVVLDSLSPSERLSFVLHDVFAVPFDEIGMILGRSPAAAKQLASRARRRVRGIEPDAIDAAESRTNIDRQQAVVEAFLAAARDGDFDRLVSLLHPDVDLHADAAGVAMGSPLRTTGADAVASTFSGRALGAQPAAIDGIIGFAWAPSGVPKVAWEVTTTNGRIVRIDMIGDVTTLVEINLSLLEA